MALPLIAAGIAARAVAKKLATRAAGGIVGAGAKSVAPVYKNIGTGSVKVTTPKGPNSVANFNTSSTSRVKDFKSGAEARRQKYMAEPDSARGAVSTAKKIKINSNPMRGK